MNPLSLTYAIDINELREEGPSNEMRKHREIQISNESIQIVPGVCTGDCALGFYLFAFTSMIINGLGSSGRITNVLINYRCVAKNDKSFSQGLFLMFISLFAMIPGPILYGYIIDQTCLIWNYKCGKRGNCQLYDQTQFRYNINLSAMSKFFR